jgi:hypothetical protein
LSRGLSSSWNLGWCLNPGQLPVWLSHLHGSFRRFRWPQALAPHPGPLITHKGWAGCSQRALHLEHQLLLPLTTLSHPTSDVRRILLRTTPLSPQLKYASILSDSHSQSDHHKRLAHRAWPTPRHIFLEHISDSNAHTRTHFNPQHWRHWLLSNWRCWLLCHVGLNVRLSPS